MNKIFVLLLVFTLGFSANGQVAIPGTDLSIKMVKARKIGVLSVQFGGTYLINSGKDNKRVQIRLKVRSENGEETLFDPNKLSLVSHEYKARFSVSEVYFATFFRSKGFQMLTTNNTEKPIFAKYDPSVPNTFNDFSVTGFKDCPIDLNFGTNRKPITHTIYFRPNTIDKNVLDVFFVVPNGLTSGEIYFGNTLISEINIRP
ncbi:hypothetical protein [Aequorivita vladivostokensis]|uniref:Uncharacterized protein n=1 Tax=Aequorivita vladivostokensis TaxID=171194 RepID=A0ABR5DK08_9FLAO|nr:hypothetical protein [Aequorivita vladivostokensis]KJJ39114.1 hypothetical protein MB09_06760 [Aequorivita vladivostokensis]